MDAALDSGVRRSPRRVFRLAGAGGVRRLTAVLTVSGLLLLGMIGSPHAASADSTPAPVPTASASGAEGTTAAPSTAAVTLTLAPDAAGVLGAAQDLGLTVSITNTTTEALAPGTVRTWLDRNRLETRAALTDWQNPSTTAAQSSNSVGAGIVIPSIAAGQTETFRASLPAAQLGLSVAGAYGLEATYTAAATIVDTRNTVVWAVGAPVQETPVAVIMPLTVPAGDRGLLTAAELETYTASGGVLATKLAAVIDSPVTLAIDPRVIVSIRVLGTAAPQSALDWLAQLASASNPSFPLAFADSDVAVERQAGAADLLVPTSFDYALNTANFQTTPTPDPFATPGQVDPALPPVAGSPTPSPTTPAAGTLPTLTELLAWPYTRTDLAWPAAATVSTDDLDFFARGGLTTSILSSNNVALPSSIDGLTPSAPAMVGDKSAIIVDAGLSDALQNATEASTGPGRDAALAELSGILAVVNAQGGASRPALVASFGRDAPASGSAISLSLDLLESLPWSTQRTLADVLSVPSLGVSVKNSDEPDSRKATVMAMLTYERQVADFSSVISKPELLTGQQRATLLAVLAQSWADDPDGRTIAEAAYATLTDTTLGSVKIIDGSNINLFATSSEVPVLVSNDLAEAVTVELQVTPSNGRLVVEPGRIEVVVEAKSQKTARVPVKAAVASGQVDLRLELFNPSGVLVNQAAPRQINVSADWEGIGTIIILAIAALLLAFGIVRQVLKRRRAKGAGASADAASAAPAAPDAPAPNTSGSRADGPGSRADG